MKIALPVISLLLCIVSIFGACKAYSLSTEKSVTTEVTALDYQHQGTFDYTVTVKPSYLYGPEPPAPLPPLPEVMKYPVNAVDHFQMTFDYSCIPDEPITGTNEEVEVRATVKAPKTTEVKEVVLLPKTRKMGDLFVTFPLNISSNSTADNITISDNVSGNEVTITAYVYATLTTSTGPVFESYTQSLPVRANGPMIEVEGQVNNSIKKNIGDLNYEQRGAFSYEVYLKPNSAYSGTVLEYPPVITQITVPDTTLTSDNTVMLNLVKSMNMSYLYHLDTSKPITKPNETVTIDAILENPGKWSKTIELVPLTSESGDFSLNFPLDLNSYNGLFEAIQQETGAPAQARNLTISAKIHAATDTSYGDIDSDFTQSITTDLAGGSLSWSDNLTKSEKKSIKTTETILQTRKYLGLPVAKLRVFSTTGAIVFFIIFAFSILWYFWFTQRKLTAIDKKVLQIRQKYKSIIVEIKELPEVKPGENVVIMDSLDDVARTAMGLLKPLLHKADGQMHTYCVYDAATRYEYRLL